MDEVAHAVVREVELDRVERLRHGLMGGWTETVVDEASAKLIASFVVVSARARPPIITNDCGALIIFH